MRDARTDEGPVRRWRDEALELDFMDCRGVPPALPEHHHRTWQLGVTTAGAVIIEVLGTRVELESGEGLVLAPSTPHAVLPSEGRAARYLQVEAPGTNRPSQRAPCFARTPATVRGRLEELAEFSWRRRLRDERARLWNEIWQEVSPSFQTPLTTSPRWGDREQAVLTYLESVEDRAVPLRELVEACGLPRTTLLRRFREALGTTPQRYHLHWRLHRVIELIDRGEPIAEAALTHGFYDQSHFNRHARPVLGMPPAQWRQRRRVT